MKNVYIRSGLNKRVNENIKELVKNVDYFKIPDFKNYKSNTISVFSDVLSRLKLFTNFKYESDEFLEKIIYSINNFDSTSVINLCDSYEFSFYRVFECLSEISITKDNFRQMFILFMELFRNGISVNSLNLSLVMLNSFDRVGVNKFCKSIFGINDHLELIGFLFENNCSLNFNLVNELEMVNEIKPFNYKDNLLRFYCLNIKNLSFKNEKFSTIIEYAYNIKMSIRYFGQRILFDEGKVLICDFNYLLIRIQEEFEDVLLNLDKLSYKEFSFVLKLFPNIKYSTEEVRRYALNGIKDNLNKNELKQIKYIIQILNDSDLNISKEIVLEFKNRFCIIEFCDSFVRCFRGYKYFYELINEFENEVYLTKTINDKYFRRSILRSLTIFYGSLSYEIVGIKILKFIMNYEDFYNESNYYINFIAEKILERSV